MNEATTIEKLEETTIPTYLIKEMINGIPFYYKGFRHVLNQTKTKTDIMGDSGLQAFIKKYIFTLLVQHLDASKYDCFMGEMGAHLDHQSNLSLDLTVFDRSVLTADKITTKYVDVPPKIVVEVDVNIELSNPNAHTFDEFVLRKVRKLHQFGTEKVIWIFSKSQTIIVATSDNKWNVLGWDKEIELLEGIQFNIAQHLEERGINK